MRRSDYVIIAAVLGLSIAALWYIANYRGWSSPEGWEAEVLDPD